MHEPDAAYRCPKCGATSALLLPATALRENYLALKCLQCAYVLRVPRQAPDGGDARLGFSSSLE